MTTKKKPISRVAMLSVHTCPLARLGGKEAGGMNVYVRELSKELGRRGIQVDIFTRTQSPITPFTHTLSDNARIIHLPAGPLKPYNKVEVFNHLPEFVNNIRNLQKCEDTSYDIIHGHYWLSGWAGLLLRERIKVPVIQMFHTLAQLKNDTARNEQDREPDFRSLKEGEIIQKVDRIVAATPVEKAQLSWRYGADQDKIEAISCGVDLRLFRPYPKAEARHALGITAKHVVLLVGRIEPIKGVDVLIRAVQELVRHGRTDFQTFIVGGGDEKQDDNPEASRLQALVQELNLGDYIKFWHSQPQNRMPLLYSAADVTVMSSHYESFGMAALESQACGTPVVATRAGGLPYAVQDKYSGFLFPDNDHEELANLIGCLLANEDLRQRMGQQAASRAEQFGWRTVADKVISLYEELAQPASRTAIAHLV